MSDNGLWDVVSGVGITALRSAAGRAIETHRANGLVCDPCAELFVTAADSPVPLRTRPEPGGQANQRPLDAPRLDPMRAVALTTARLGAR